MEKLKNILNPGAKHDEEVMYGSGKSSDPVHSGTTVGASGHGSHPGSHPGSSQMGHNPLSSGSHPTSSNTSSGYGGSPTPGGQHSTLTGNAPSRSGPSVAFDDGASTASIKSGIQGHPQSGSGLIGSSGTDDPVDTNKPLPNTPAPGLTGGNITAGPNKSGLGNRADPRLESGLDGSSGLGAGRTGAGLPDRSIGSSGNDPSHLGGNTTTGSEGIGGPIGSGVRGYGPADWEHDHQRHGHRYEGDPCAHGNVDPAGPHLTSGPHATDTANRLDPHVAGNTGPLETTAGEGVGHQHGHQGASTTGTGVLLTGAETGSGGSGTRYDSGSNNRSSGPEAALAGGVGATGVGAYEAERHHHHGQVNPAATSTTSTPGAPSTDYPSTHSRSGVDPRVDPTSRSGITSTGNDRQLGGNAGNVGAGGLAAHEAEKHLHSRDDPGRTSGLSGTTAGTTGRDYDRTRGSFIPGTDHHTNTDHHHGRDKGVAGAGAVGGAEVSKHEAEKHRTEGDSHKGKKHGGLLGFLHHDKDSTSDRSTRHSGHGHDSHHDSHQGAKTAAGAGTAGAGTAGAGTGAHGHEKHDHERNRLHKDPPEGYASQVTGGTGTTTLAEGDSVQRGSHMSGLGNKLDPNVSGRGESLRPGEVIEPHTGLPTNISKYGTGRGGTDATPAPGYHTHNNP